MEKIIVVFSDERKRELVAGALEEAGLRVYRRCATGADALRAIDAVGDGVIVCGARMTDRTADELTYDMEGRAQVLVAARPESLEMCEHPDLFRLSAPFSRGELASAVSMLLQLHRMRLPRRSEEERRLIERAKVELMRRHSMTEPEAHAYLQRESMRSGKKITEIAGKVLEGAMTE